MSKIILFVLILSSCSNLKGPPKPAAPREFSRGEVILTSQLLQKIFDEDMAPLTCVPDSDEASLLLRTIRPRMEVAQDDMEAMLDDTTEIDQIISNCDKDCTCGFVDELLREHQVNLSKKQQKMLTDKKVEKEINRCLSYAQTTFCKGEFYQELNKEKADFSFEE
jgi:hypothetical protein